MPVEVITSEELEIFRIRLPEDLKKVLEPTNTPKKVWLKSKELRSWLNISPNTLEGPPLRKLQPAKFGGSLHYRFAEIEKMIEDGMK